VEVVTRMENPGRVLKRKTNVRKVKDTGGFRGMGDCEKEHGRMHAQAKPRKKKRETCVGGATPNGETRKRNGGNEKT